MDDAVLNIIIKARDQATQAVKGVSGAVSSSVGKLGEVGKKANEIGGELSKKVTLPILAAGAASIKFATDFNTSMANVATLIPGNSARVAELKNNVQSMAVEVGKSTADLANGLYQVISAFGDTSDSTKILEVNAKAAAAGMAETTDAINLTSAVTKGYGDTSAEAVQKASDLALLTVRLGQTTFPELAASIGRVTPLAAGLNVAQEELFGTMATFTGVTGGAAEVSTQLRGVLQALMAPTDGMRDLMERMGYETGAAMIKGEGLQGTINAIVAEAKKTGAPLQDFIGSIEGQTLAMAATGGQADNYTQKIKEMAQANGTTDEAFAEMTSGVNEAGFKMQQARAEMEVMAQKVGDQLAPVIIEVTKHVGKLTDWFGRLSPQGQKTVVMVAGVVAAIGPALIIFGKLAMGIKAVAAALTFLGAHPIVLVVMAIIAAIAAIAFLIIKNWDTLKAWFMSFWQFMTALWTTIRDVAVSVWQAIFNVVKTVLGAIWAVIEPIINLWMTLFKAYLAVVTYVFLVIKGLITVVIQWLWNTIIKPYLELWMQYFRLVWSVVSAVFNAIKNFIASAIQWAWARIRPVLDAVKGGFNSLWGTVKSVFDKIANVVGGVAGSISNGFSKGFEGAKNIAKGAVNWMIDKINTVIRGVNSTAGKLPGVPDIGEIPKLAKGGVVKSRPGGTAAILGEAGSDEAVIPLNNSSASQRIREALGGGTSGGGQQQVVNITNNNTFVRDTDPMAFARMQAFELSRR